MRRRRCLKRTKLFFNLLRVTVAGTRCAESIRTFFANFREAVVHALPDCPPAKPNCSVWISPELCALRRQSASVWRAGLVDPPHELDEEALGPSLSRAQDASGHASEFASQHQAKPDHPATPWQRIRLRRDGQRPLVAHGALLFRCAVAARLPTPDEARSPARGHIETVSAIADPELQPPGPRIALSISAYLLEDGGIVLVYQLDSATRNVLIPQFHAHEVSQPVDIVSFQARIRNRPVVTEAGDASSSLMEIVEEMKSAALRELRLRGFQKSATEEVPGILEGEAVGEPDIGRSVPCSHVANPAEGAVYVSEQ